MMSQPPWRPRLCSEYWASPKQSSCRLLMPANASVAAGLTQRAYLRIQLLDLFALVQHLRGEHLVERRHVAHAALHGHHLAAESQQLLLQRHVLRVNLQLLLLLLLRLLWLALLLCGSCAGGSERWLLPSSGLPSFPSRLCHVIKKRTEKRFLYNRLDKRASNEAPVVCHGCTLAFLWQHRLLRHSSADIGTAGTPAQ